MSPLKPCVASSNAVVVAAVVLSHLLYIQHMYYLFPSHLQLHHEKDLFHCHYHTHHHNHSTKVDVVKQLVSYYPKDLAWATTADQIDEAFASGNLNGCDH